MTAAMPGEGRVDQYLDELFDRLAGTGAAGRRMLAEAESHLLAATEDGLSQGLDAEAAEREAVERFGAVSGIARQVPATAGSVRASMRRFFVGAWATAGVVMTWYGLSGVVTWMLGWPWVRLLIATDRFGTQPNMCDRPWVPSDPALDCVRHYHDQLYLIPVGADEVPRPLFAILAASGALLLLALMVVRRTTSLGTPAWTPAPTPSGLAVATSFGLTAAVLLLYAVTGGITSAQDWAPSYLTTGLLASVIAIVAARRTWLRTRTTSASMS
ncbi:permease prefix domain 1-containing protein [Micromonospora globbae]|uniref:Uncharacterized protein n=1 Tax=Micromonospora globbae TaxID=1894969 RepID=A0A420ESN0_9ACTN|nr:permease prefix domain 1-containing protein [Micromonospora globbae]RKF23653.1 hypothetical protein D7I43_30450 [Micromonospora globbae]